MRFTFFPDPETHCRCTGGDAGINFTLSQDPAFENRDFHFWEDSFLFDGYSHWFRGNANCLPEGAIQGVEKAGLPDAVKADLKAFYQEHKR